MGLILNLIAILLFLFVFIIDFLFSLVYDVKNKKWFKYTSNKNKDKAMDIDIFANYTFGDLWNFVLSTKGNNYKFGKFGETLSSCLGRKYLENSLNFVGLILFWILNIIDITKYTQGGHCVWAIQTDDEINNFGKRNEYTTN